MKIEDIIKRGEQSKIELEVENSDSIIYFLVNSNGEKIKSETIKINNKENTIKISPEDTRKLELGGNSIKIFATSESVLKPDFYETSFVVTDENVDISNRLPEDIKFQENETGNGLLVILILAIGFMIIGIYFYKIKSFNARCVPINPYK